MNNLLKSFNIDYLITLGLAIVGFVLMFWILYSFLHSSFWRIKYTWRISDKIKNTNLSKEAKIIANREFACMIETHHSRYARYRSYREITQSAEYLEILLYLPWNQYSKLDKDIKQIKQELQLRYSDNFTIIIDNICNLIKEERITDQPIGQAMCLVGPPGIGKTAIIKDIAKAIGRAYKIISLNGIIDPVEIIGYRYEPKEEIIDKISRIDRISGRHGIDPVELRSNRHGSGLKYGKIIQVLSECDTANPVIALEDIDKAGPAVLKVLCSVLDSAVNSQFVDSYLGVSFDLSKVIFIATANNLNSVDHRLLEILHSIELTGYTKSNKIYIAKQYIIPDIAMKYNKQFKIQIEDDCLGEIIDKHTEEAGIRKLKQLIELIYRKVRCGVFEENFTENNNIIINKDNLYQFLDAKQTTNNAH